MSNKTASPSGENSQIHNQMVRILKFEKRNVPLFEHDQQHWMSGEIIGECLEYENPRRSVNNIYNRHQEELDPFSSVINLVTEAGVTRSVRVFNEQGAYLIAMFAKTKKAKAVRAWLAGLPKMLRKIANTVQISADQIQELVENSFEAHDYMKERLISHDQRIQDHRQVLADILSRVEELETETRRPGRYDYRNSAQILGTVSSAMSNRDTTVSEFVQTCCVVESGLAMSTAELNKEYQAWCYLQDLAALGRNTFYQVLAGIVPGMRYDTGFVVDKNSNYTFTRLVKGICLKEIEARSEGGAS